MGFAVILYLDPAAEAEVRSLWASLAEKDISSVMATMGIRPHVSLAGLEHVEAGPFCQALDVFAQSMPPVAVKFESVGTFPTEQGVVYLAPIVTRELLRLHEEFSHLLVEMGLASHDYYRPGNWVPHCTAAINLTPEEVSAAVTVCCQSDVFHAATLTHIGLVEYLPVREICTFPLGGMTHVEPH
jgi:2'-5' RNA ligase